MTLTTEQLTTLERLGATFFSIKDAAIVLQVDFIHLKKAIADPTSPAHQSYYRGKLTAEMDLRESIMKMAKRGSNPSVKTMLDLLTKANTANI